MQRKGRGWEMYEQAISILVNINYSIVISCCLITKIGVNSLYTLSQDLKEILSLAQKLIIQENIICK
jgi:hypothetical protein